MTHVGDVEDFDTKLPQGEYIDAWVAYLDILGYRNLVRAALQAGTVERSIDRLRASVLIPKRVYEQTWGKQKSDAVTVRLISDSVVVSAPTDQCTCWWFVFTVDHLVASFSRHGLFVRGALARGGHYDDGVIIFSPALVEAYEVESREAVHPRVIVPDSLQRAFAVENCRSPNAVLNELTEHLVWQDADGKFFLNYLFRYWSRFFWAGGPARAKQYLSNHKACVQDGLQKHREDERIFGKYRWLGQYHNRFCHSLLDEGEARKLLIPADSLR